MKTNINYYVYWIRSLESKLAREYSLDLAFPNRKNSKFEYIKAEIMDLERQLALLEQGLEDQTYEEYKQEYMVQEPELTEEEKKIAELEAQLAALRG